MARARCRVRITVRGVISGWRPDRPALVFTLPGEKAVASERGSKDAVASWRLLLAPPGLPLHVSARLGLLRLFAGSQLLQGISPSQLPWCSRLQLLQTVPWRFLCRGMAGLTVNVDEVS